jgi:hypothetical protein
MTDGVIVITPRTVADKLTLTIDPRSSFRIRGPVTDRSGKRIAGTRVQLRWIRKYVSEIPESRGRGNGGALESYTTPEVGWFDFGDLWPDDR